jgi:hypothetical protein
MPDTDPTIEVTEEPGTGDPPPPPPEDALAAAAALDPDAGSAVPGSPTAEIIRVLREQWRVERARAEAAEQAARALDAKVREVEASLAAAREALDSVERRHRIDLALLEEDAVDLETARLLTEAAVSRMPERDIAAILADLRRTKPFLFRGRPRAAGAAMAPAGAPSDPLEDLASDAARSGDRGSLLRYLRARRGA